MIVDRDFQREVLIRLSESYPQPVSWPENIRMDDHAVDNMHYLKEHGVIEMEWYGASMVGKRPMWARATVKGVDFIADDGGLTAAFGVVTVRLHDDEFKRLLVAHISRSEGDQTVRDQMIETVKGLPAHAISAAASKVFEVGLANLPVGVSALRAIFASP